MHRVFALLVVTTAVLMAGVSVAIAQTLTNTQAGPATVAELRARAERGDADAQYDLGQTIRVPAQPPTPTEAALEQQTHAKINDYRVSKRLAALTWNDVIAERARQHSRNMANGSVAFGHGGLSARMEVIAQSISLASLAENVAVTSTTSDPAATAVSEWLNSADHRAHIEGSSNLTGIGVARSVNGYTYFTQILIKSR